MATVVTSDAALDAREGRLSGTDPCGTVLVGHPLCHTGNSHDLTECAHCALSCVSSAMVTSRPVNWRGRSSGRILGREDSVDDVVDRHSDTVVDETPPDQPACRLEAP